MYLYSFKHKIKLYNVDRIVSASTSPGMSLTKAWLTLRNMGTTRSTIVSKFDVRFD